MFAPPWRLRLANRLIVTTVQLDGPRAGEVLVEIRATGICHTDEFTLSGADPEGLFPSILGDKGAGAVVETGISSVKKGDHVIPLYTPECRSCPSCLSRKTNLCTAIRATQGQGVMPTAPRDFQPAVKKFTITWAVRHSRISPSYPKSRWRKSARTRLSTRCATSAAASPPASACKSRTWRPMHCVWSRRHRLERYPRASPRLRRNDHRRRCESGEKALGRALRHDAFRQSRIRCRSATSIKLSP